MVGDEDEEEEQGVTGGIHHDWLEIDRIIAKDKAGRYLVKWRGLGYSDATWENSLMSSDKVHSPVYFVHSCISMYICQLISRASSSAELASQALGLA